MDELTGVVPAAGHARRYAQIVRENALLRRLLKSPYEIQESVLGHQAPPRELVEQAEKAMLEVARDDRQQDFRAIEEVLHEELDKLHRPVARRHLADRHAVRASRTSTRSPAASSRAT